MTQVDITGADTAPVLKVSDLSVGLPANGDRIYAVQNTHLSLREGKTVCLVGESGSGKSVIGNAILGMLPPALPQLNGQIFLRDKALPQQRDPAYNALRSKQISMIFQDASASLNPVRRISSQLAEILMVHGIPASEHNTRIDKALRAVRLDEPERIMKAYPHQMSGGQAQRVVIAGALLLNPSVLIADEPTTALDVTTQASILRLLSDLKKDLGLAILFITHDFGVVAEIADHVAVMKEGLIVEQGPVKQVLQDPQDSYTQRLIAAAQPSAPTRIKSDNRILLKAQDLDLTYRGGGLLNRSSTHALCNVSINVAKGQTVGVVGESGSGKSSLARALLRLEDIDHGTIYYEDKDITQLKGKELQKLRKSVQVVLQDPFSALNPRQTIRSAIAEGPIIHGMAKEDALAKAEELLELTGLPIQAAERFPHEFSGGQRQRICIARALALEPDLLIADEPVSALDVSIQAQILSLFAEMQDRFGFAMLFITHDLGVARAICDDIVVMKLGEIVERGPASVVLEKPTHDYTKELLSAAPKLDLSRIGALA